MLAQIVQMVAEAQRTRALFRSSPIVASYFVPLVMGRASVCRPALFGPQSRLAHGWFAGGSSYSRLSVPRVGDADVDYGGDGQGRRRGVAIQER